MTDVQATLLGTIIGGVIGVIGTYLGAMKIADRQRFIDAGRRLREAFQDELAILRGPDDCDAFTLLNSSFKKHLIAITEFRYVLHGNKIESFNRAWLTYHCTSEAPFIHLLEQYDTKTGSREQRNKNRELAIQRINRILSFTEYNSVCSMLICRNF